MRAVLAVLVTSALALAQFIPFPGPGRSATAGSANVSLDAITSDANAASTAISVPTPSMTSGSNRVLFVMLGTATDTPTDPIGISGAGATWTAVGSAVQGNGFFRGRCYVGIGPTSTGVVNLTVTYSTEPTYGLVATVAHYHNANQTAGNYTTCPVTTSGSQVLTIPSGGYGTSTQFDTQNARGVSGCTSTPHYSTFDVSVAYAAASCTQSSSTFTWSGFGTNSIAIGGVIPKQ